MKVPIKKQVPRVRIAIIEHNGGKEISHFIRNDNFNKSYEFVFYNRLSNGV